MVTIINNKTWEGSGVKKKVKCLGEQLFDKEFFFVVVVGPTAVVQAPRAWP